MNEFDETHDVSNTARMGVPVSKTTKVEAFSSEDTTGGTRKMTAVKSEAPTPRTSRMVSVISVDATPRTTGRESLEFASDFSKKWRDDGYETWDDKTVTDLRRTINECFELLLPMDEIKIIICGGASHGKSSLINNCMAALSGIYSQVAKLGCGQETITKQYKEFQTWRMEDGSVRNLPLIFADTRGITDSRKHGAPVAAVKACILGKVVNGETIDPKIADKEWIERKQQTKKVSYIFFVADATTIPTSVRELKPLFKNLRQIRDFSKTEDIPVAAFVTKCDNLDPVVKKDPSILHYSEAVERSVNLFSPVVDIPVNRVFPVVNYTDQIKTSNEMMIQTLFALKACLDDIRGDFFSRLHLK